MAVPQKQQLFVRLDTNRFEFVRQILSHFLVRRLLKGILTIFLVSSLTFFLIRLMPGNPVEAYIQTLIVQQNLSYEQAKQQAAVIFRIARIQ